MTFNITTESLSTNNGVVTLEEGVKSITLRSDTQNKIFTDNYITSGTYVFQRGIKIPLAYISSIYGAGGLTASYNFSVSSGTISASNNCSATVSLPSYYSQLASVAIDSSVAPTYFIGSCRSSLTPTTTQAVTESNYFLTNHYFNSSAYNYSDRAPTVAVNDAQLPYSDSLIKGEASGSNEATVIQVETYNYNYYFTCLMVQL